MPIAASSFAVRATSSSAERSGRATRMSGLRTIGEPSTAARVAVALLFQTRQRAKTRGIALARFQKSAPRTGQFEQPDGVARRRRIEDDVIVAVADVASPSTAR